MEREDASTVNVIKRMSGSSGPRGVIKNQTLAARRDAEGIVDDARLQADTIVQNAVREAEQVLEEAYREGTERALAEFEKQLVEIRGIRLDVMRDAERDLLTLAVRIAEKILGKELTSNKETITDIVSTALRNARQRERVTVSVNPADLGSLDREAEKFSSDEKIRILNFVADPAVPVGGCVIETEVGKIDARLETQFKVIENALLSQSDGGESI